MPIHVETRPWHEAEADWLIVGVPQESEFTEPLRALNDALGGSLERLRESGDLTGELAELREMLDVPDIAARRLLLVGLGKPDELDVTRLDKALMTAARRASEKQSVSVAIALPETMPDSLTPAQCAQTAAVAATVGCVGQGHYRSEPGRHPFSSVTLLAASDAQQAEIREAAERGRMLGEAVNITRELVDRTALDIYPETFAKRAEELAAEYGLACEIFDENRLADEKMGAMLGVAGGSERPPRMVVLEHRAGGDAPTLALCGKGVTFDSGGLSLKPTDGMKIMKCDMAGAATVLGAMTALARLQVPVNVIGYMGMVENMPSGSAYRVGDVLTARNGTTIEVLNTDAEGRLVLADVLSYAVDHGAEKLIDLATLTGSCVVALGEEVTGVFSNNQPWCDDLLAAAKRCGERAWQLPMDEHYAELLKSDVADCKNVGPRWGGAILAGKFLEKFVGGKPWVHLDIAGTAFASSNQPHREGGGTGCMVRTLVETAAGFQN